MAAHGTRSSYVAGCGCRDCTDASSRYHRDYYLRKQAGEAGQGRGMPAVPELPPSDWARLGACTGLDPAMFFPERGEPTGPAKAVCADCTVTSECLQWALDTSQKFGIWGGRSEKERRRLKVESAEIPAGPAVCACCGDRFEPRRRTQRYCSTDCRMYDRQRRTA